MILFSRLPEETTSEHQKSSPQNTRGLSISIGSERRAWSSSWHVLISQAFVQLRLTGHISNTNKMAELEYPCVYNRDSQLPINIHGTVLVISLKKLWYSCGCSRNRSRAPGLPDGLFSASYLFSIPLQKIQTECNTIGLYNNYSKSLYSLEEIASLS